MMLLLNGCVGPNKSESFFIVLNSTFGFSVILFFVSILWIKIISMFREGELRDLPNIMTIQLVGIFIVSALISSYIFIYKSDVMTFRIMGDDPITEWIALQFLAIFHTPIIAFYSIITLSVVRIKPFLRYFYLFLPLLIHISISYIKAFYWRSHFLTKISRNYNCDGVKWNAAASRIERRW